MPVSSRLTHLLLAIIALCLVVIAVKPVPILPDVSAQAAAPAYDRDRPFPDRRSRDAEELTASITAANPSGEAQAAATLRVAAAIETLAKNNLRVADAIDSVARSIDNAGARLSGGTPGEAVRGGAGARRTMPRVTITTVPVTTLP